MLHAIQGAMQVMEVWMQSMRDKAEVQHVNQCLQHCEKQVVGRAMCGGLGSSRVAVGLLAVPNIGAATACEASPVRALAI